MIDVNVDALFDAWNSALATCDPNCVASLYADDAILLPTVSDRVRYTNAQIRDYFEAFVARQPQGVVEERVVHPLGETYVATSGVYMFAFGDGSTNVRARFTFVYTRTEAGVWKILHHHSSATPRV